MIEIDVPSHYVGREQAFVKHHFLRSYLERLVHKIASVYDEVVYVDGYSGPWKSEDEAYADTSFGIALQSLTAARKSWLEMPQRRRDVRMTAHLVEKQIGPFRELSGIGGQFSQVTVHPHRGDFVGLAPTIANSLPSRAFTFSLIDPKGFKIDLEALRPLLSRPRSEVVFNFMFDFANRFTVLPSLSNTYDRLFPGVDWRARLAAVSDDPNAGPAERKAAFLECFKDAVREVGGFTYVADVDIRYPGKDRTYYFLVYGTRDARGIEVFRDCQVKALEAQSTIAGQMSIAKRETAGQSSLFGTEWEKPAVSHRQFLGEERAAARSTLLEIATKSPGAAWGSVWPRLLAAHAIRKTDAGAIANSLRKEAAIEFPGWPSGKRVPSDEYRVFAV
ncbi:three-Cys-motif partner protein TcmP [Porphyrobacter sp. GA68]|uniref:three-Cys-motif partner protein TcmP n=1 Tax=Porphyrobacter sp. GA68 TaxID=2883480 RepID=UPI001D180AB4|nr:three-Cys-motif partner protein TcmP [Porphyrobacter sp. GA68]